MKELIVWDLFGGGSNSVYKALKEHLPNSRYEVYTFDVNPKIYHEKQYIVDLSMHFNDLIREFDKYPTPDIIVASPLCQSFSLMLSMKGGGTCCWKWDNTINKLVQRDREEFERLKSGFTRNKNYDRQLFVANLGEQCILNTLMLIDHYAPKYWYIENPKTSLMWKYIEFNTNFYKYHTCYKNDASYGLYGYPIQKPTCFLSNVKMPDLLNGKSTYQYSKKIINGKEYYVLLDKKVLVRNNSRSHGIELVRKLGHCSNNKKNPTHQLSEIGNHSSIPYKLILAIFGYFHYDWEELYETK